MVYTDLSSAQRTGHRCDQSLETEKAGYWFGLLACLGGLIAALSLDLCPDLPLLFVVALLYLHQRYALLSGIAQNLDRWALSFQPRFLLPELKVLFRALSSDEADLPLKMAINSYVMPPPAAPSLSGSV